MLRENKTKTKLGRGEAVYGVIAASPDPLLAELAGSTGYDYYMLDAEHGPLSPAHAADVVRACEAADVTPLVRVGQRDAKVVLQYLDAGMLGVMMPGLETADDVRALVAAVKYPPLGRRGLGMVRPAGYMLGAWRQAGYVADANAQTLVWPQFEDAALLDRLPAMAAVPGVDGFVIGPRDLSMSMGYYDGPDHPAVQAVIDQALAVLRQAGVAGGMTAGTAAAARRQVGRGARIILDALPSLVQRGARAFLEGDSS